MTRPPSTSKTGAPTRGVIYRPGRRGMWGAVFLIQFLAVLLMPDEKPGADIGIAEASILFLGAVILAAAWAYRLVITRNLGDSTLCIDSRWFFSRKRDATHPTDEICDVAVEVERKAKSCGHRVVLILHDNARIPITDDFIDNGRHHERAAREIRALLQLPNQDAPVTVLNAPEIAAAPLP